MNASFEMQNIMKNGQKNFILTSGTLSPLRSFE